MKLFPFFIALLINSSSLAQNMVLNHPLSSKVFSTDKYSGIDGSPFLYDKWISGSATIAKGYYNNLELRLDAYSNTLYFNKDGEPYEFVDDVKKFILMPTVTDSSSYQYYKKGISGAGINTNQYVQVFFEGPLSLYRSDIKLLSEVNQINVGVVKTFTASTRYFIMKDNTLKLIKLNKKEVFEIIKDKEGKINAYVTEQKLSTKKEADLIAILKYYNTL
jgi:hypothetical protein